MKTKLMIVILCGVAIGIPALAAMDMPGTHDHMTGPMTRTSVEAMVKEHFAQEIGRASCRERV